MKRSFNEINLAEIQLLKELEYSSIKTKLTFVDVKESINLLDSLLESNLKMLKNQNIALLFSGGIDSAILAYKMTQLNIDFQPILIANKKEIDYKNAIEAAKILNLNLVILPLTMEIFEPLIPKIMKTIGNTDEKQINISAPFFIASEYMMNNNLNTAVLGQGADEIFCGYQRYVDFMIENPTEFKKYHLEDIKSSILKNFTRDNGIFKSKAIDLYCPYFKDKIIELAISIPNKILIDFNEKPPIKKNFLRLYSKKIGLDSSIGQKKKVAIQFGSGSYKMLKKIANKHGFTKPFCQQHGYLRHVQLYLDYLAQINGIQDFKLELKKEIILD